MANKVRGSETTFRVAGLPPGVTEADATSIIDQVCGKLGELEFPCRSTVHSLGHDPYSMGQETEMVATITFENIPPHLRDETNLFVEKEAEFRGERIRMSLRIDINFLGFTPLNEVHLPQDEIIDCIVVSGLASHAYGSWKSRKGHFMWLRDDVMWRKPNVRVLLYGYDTTLVKSESFQTIKNIGTELGGSLSRIRRISQQGQFGLETRPIVFIAHSLGGLVVKEAICKMSMSKEENQRITASCVYGLIFFGVPNTGIRIEHWLPIVKDQPNEVLVRDLRPGSEYLLNLQKRFEAQFTYPKSKVLSIFETMRTRTAKFDDGRWQLTGPREILVQEASATKPMDKAPESISLYTMQMNQNHAELPKFAHRRDLNYTNLAMQLEDFWQNAIDDVRSRITSQMGLHEAESIAMQSTLSPEFKDERAVFGGNDDESISYDHSDVSQAAGTASEPTEILPATGRQKLVRYDHSPMRSHTPLHQFLQSRGSDSGEDLARDSSVRTLQHAVACGRADVVSWFLSKGANVHKRDSSGATLLHTAVDHGHIDLMGLLLGRGADVNSTDSKGLAPMHLVPAGRSDIIDLLVGSGSHVDVKDCNDNSPLMLAVLQGQAERVRTYLGNGADVNAAEPISVSIEVEGDTVLPPILVAVHEKHTSVLKVLVEHGADLRPTFTKLKRTALHYAVARYYLEAVRCLVLAKVDIEAQDTEGDTALHEVALKGNGVQSEDILQLLLDAGANIEAKDRYGFTALHVAAQEGALGIAKGLLDAGASIAARSDYFRTPLHQAARNGHLEVVQRLLDEGADIHEKDKNGETALHIACHTRCDDNLSVIKHLLGRGAAHLAPADLDKTGGRLPPHQAALFGFKEAVELFLNMRFNKSSSDSQGVEMIHHAASHGHVDVLKLLLERGTATGCRTRVEGHRPLHLAARGGHVEATSVLCKFGANVNIPSWKNGYYPIHYAARGGHIEVISLLHKKGATIDALDDQLQTALSHAVERGQTRAVSLLCEYGASVNHAGRSGRRILTEAVSLGRVDIVSILCQKGANVQIDMNTHALTGYAPLIEAVRQKHIEVARVLLEHGADIDVPSKKQSWTPLHAAAYQGHKEMVELLLGKGANRKLVTKDGETAWALAREMGHHELCKILGKPQRQPKPHASYQNSDSGDSTKAVVSGKTFSRK